MTAIDRLVAAWERWDDWCAKPFAQRAYSPEDRVVANARIDAVAAVAAKVNRGPIEIMAAITERRRAGLDTRAAIEAELAP